MLTFTGEPCGPPPYIVVYNNIAAYFAAIQAHAKVN
jgi:hypothetical protein